MAKIDRLPEQRVSGARIQEQRKKRGFTRADVGAAVGVSAAAVERWELRGGQPRVGNLSRLAAFLGCAIADLFDDPTLF